MRRSYRRRRTSMLRAVPIGAIAVALGLVAVGCGSSDSSGAASSGTSDQPAAATKKVSIALEVPFAGIEFVQAIIAGAKQSGKDFGPMDLKISSWPGPSDATGAIKQVSDLLATGPDAIGISPFPPPLWRTSIQTALKQTDGKVLSIVGDDGDGTAAGIAGALVKNYVGLNFAELSRKKLTAGIKAAGLSPSTTGYTIIGQCGNKSKTGYQYQVVQGFTEVFHKLLPKVEVRVFDSQNDPQENTNAWMSKLQANPDPAIVASNCAQDGDSLYLVKKKLGLKFPVVGGAVTPKQVAGLHDGSILLADDANWWMLGYVSVKLLADAARGIRPIPDNAWIDPGDTLVDKSNVDAVAARNASTAAMSAYYEKYVVKDYLAADSQGVATYKGHLHPLADAFR
jgi:ABC-type sugar transport system substrate-binding protein